MLWYSSGPLAGPSRRSLQACSYRVAVSSHAAIAQHRHPRRAPRRRRHRPQPRPRAVARRAREEPQRLRHRSRPAWPSATSSRRSARLHPEHGFLGEESGAQRRRRVRLDHRPARRHHQLPARLSGVRGVDRLRVPRPRSSTRVVYDPMRQELFTASRGDGAQLDGRRIRVSKQIDARRRADRHRVSRTARTRAGSTPTSRCSRPSCSRPPASAARAPRRSISPTSRPAALDGFWEIGLDALGHGGRHPADHRGRRPRRHADRRRIRAGRPHRRAARPRSTKRCVDCLAPHVPAESARGLSRSGTGAPIRRQVARVESGGIARPGASPEA